MFTTKGRLQLFGRIFKVPKAFKGMPVAIRPTTDDGVGTCSSPLIKSPSLTSGTMPNILKCVHHVSEHPSTMCPVHTEVPWGFGSVSSNRILPRGGTSCSGFSTYGVLSSFLVLGSF